MLCETAQPNISLSDYCKQHEAIDGQIRAMYEGKLGWAARSRVQETKLRVAFDTLHDQPEQQAALYRLVYGLRGHSLLTVAPVLPSFGAQPGNTAIDVLLHLARYSDHWQCEPEGWHPATDDLRDQVSSLTRHLFVLYPLPEFLGAAWLSGFHPAGESYREWFVHLGKGGKLESLRFPMPMTHRAAHYFLLAPDSYTIPAALHYGQIRAMGGSEMLADAVSESFLADLQSDEPFWFSILQFFVNHPELSPAQWGPIADYIRFRKFGSGKDDAPEPKLSMKGRTVEALLHRLEEWHETLARLGRKTPQTWDSAGYPPLDRIEKDRLSAATCHWRIVEITDTLSLLEEGRDMRHCVRSYQDGCVSGKTSIWSLRLTLSDNPGMRRLLTIEVNNSRRTIVQVRGKCNQTLGAMRGNYRMMLARDILRDWAREQRLGITCAL